MPQGTHVPKFGNWDGDNVPYTVYFENARKEKTAGVRMNPNDPEENPDAFIFREDKLRNEGQKQQRGHCRRSMRMTSEADTDKSNSDHALLHQNHHATRPDRKKSVVEANGSSFSSPARPERLRNGVNPTNYRTAAVPKFGEWDENDPKSGEGFTFIFSKVKEEKHIAASKLPTATQQNSNPSNIQKKKTKSKKCCCLF